MQTKDLRALILGRRGCAINNKIPFLWVADGAVSMPMMFAPTLTTPPPTVGAVIDRAYGCFFMSFATPSYQEGVARV